MDRVDEGRISKKEKRWRGGDAVDGVGMKTRG